MSVDAVKPHADMDERIPKIISQYYLDVACRTALPGDEQPPEAAKSTAPRRETFTATKSSRVSSPYAFTFEHTRNNCFSSQSLYNPYTTVNGDGGQSAQQQGPSMPHEPKVFGRKGDFDSINGPGLNGPNTARTSAKNCNHSSNFFEIHCDNEEEAAAAAPRENARARVPLATAPGATNTARHPRPRRPDVPFTFNPADPNWEDKENVDPRLSEGPPRAADQGARHRREPFGYRYQAPPYYPYRVFQGIPNPFAPRRPKSMVLYHLLELTTHLVSKKEIERAYKKVAMKNHPDKSSDDEREAATIKMQHINIAKEVLLDEERRETYHLDGKLPWVA